MREYYFCNLGVLGQNPWQPIQGTTELHLGDGDYVNGCLSLWEGGLSNSEGSGGITKASQILSADPRKEGFQCSIRESVKLAHEGQQLAMVSWTDEIVDEAPIATVSDWVL